MDNVLACRKAGTYTEQHKHRKKRKHIRATRLILTMIIVFQRVKAFRASDGEESVLYVFMVFMVYVNMVERYVGR